MREWRSEREAVRKKRERRGLSKPHDNDSVMLL